MYLRIIAFSMLMLAGCATKDGHVYIEGRCITCINNPIKGEAVNHNDPVRKYRDPEENVRANKQAVIEEDGHEQEYYEGRVKFSVKPKVDIVYLALKREFGFKTRKEREQPLGRYKGWLDSAEEFRYEALPGVSYHMRENTQHKYKGIKARHTIDVVLETSYVGTNVVITYWIQQPKSALRSYGKSLKTRSLKALN